MTPDLEIDATGLLCPLPVLRARKALAALRARSTGRGQRRPVASIWRSGVMADR